MGGCEGEGTPVLVRVVLILCMHGHPSIPNAWRLYCVGTNGLTLTTCSSVCAYVYRSMLLIKIADTPMVNPTPVSCGGTLYTVGRTAGDDKPISTVYTYITARDQWVSVGDMSVKRSLHCAVPLSDNTIFVAGGSSPDDEGIDLSMSLLKELLLL